MSSSDNTKVENPGMVTSDSLGAESIQEGGSFALDSENRGPMSQPSHSTNTNTTDISNATRLAPAPDAEARQASEEWNEAAQLNAGRTLNASSRSTEPELPESQPKGKNLKEGGFDPDAPNASWTTDIGGKKDPGREALNRLDLPGTGGTGPRQDKLTKDGQFDVLKDASA